MRKILLAVAAAVLASSGAWAGSVICQPIGDATVCSDGTIAQPFGNGAYVTKTPRDAWGKSIHDNEGKPQWNNKAK